MLLKLHVVFDFRETIKKAFNTKLFVSSNSFTVHVTLLYLQDKLKQIMQVLQQLRSTQL